MGVRNVDLTTLEAEPDKRAGIALKTERSTSWIGEHDLRLPFFLLP